MDKQQAFNERALQLAKEAHNLANLAKIFVGHYGSMQFAVDTKAFDGAVAMADRSMRALIRQAIIIAQNYAPELLEGDKVFNEEDE